LHFGQAVPLGQRRDSRYFLAVSTSGKRLKSWKVLIVLRLISCPSLKEYYSKPCCVSRRKLKYLESQTQTVEEWLNAPPILCPCGCGIEVASTVEFRNNEAVLHPPTQVFLDSLRVELLSNPHTKTY
jgi:hypothetical protein